MLVKQSVAEKLLSVPISKTGWRGMTFMAALFLSGDYLKQRGSLVAAFSRTAHALKHYGAIRDFTTSVNKIDDILDSSFGEKILAAGSAKQGPEICDFLKNPEICPEAYFACLNQLVDLGLTDRETAIAFSNLFGVMMHSRATHEILARKDSNPVHRQAMSDLTLKVTEAYTVFIYRCFNYYRHDYGDVSKFDHAQATTPYPDITRLSHLGQIIDDVRDFILDLQSELDTGIASPNWLAAQLASRGQLTDDKARLLPDIKNFVEKNHHREDSLLRQEWPDSIRACLEDTNSYFENQVKFIRGRVAQSIIKSYLHISLDEGLKTPSHPDIVEKAEKEIEEQKLLSLRYG